MITIINGAPGSGKTKTAQYLFETTDRSAFIDGDWLLAVTPSDRNNEDQRRLRYANIATLAKNYHEAGFTNIFISFVYIKSPDLNEQIDLLRNIDSIKVFSLVPDADTLRKRHAEDSYKREEIESSIKLSKLIATLENIEIIDNSDLSIEEVAKRIKEKLGLL